MVRINFHGAKKSISTVVKTISIVLKINFYHGKHQFQEDQALPQATPNSLKPPLIGPSCDGRVALE